LSFSAVQSKRLRVAIAIAIPMNEDDIDRGGRSNLEAVAFQRKLAVCTLYRAGFTGAQVGELMNMAETSASQARAIIKKRAERAREFKQHLDEVWMRFDASTTR
jgi:hypothetical protein